MTPTTTKVYQQPNVTNLPIAHEMSYALKAGTIGFTFEKLLKDYLTPDCTLITVEDPYIRINYQIENFVRLCEGKLQRQT